MFGDLWRFDTPRYRELDWVRQAMDDLFQDFGVADIRSAPRAAFPLVNVGATGDSVCVYVFAPGVDPKELEVTIQDNVLTLQGKREVPAAGGEGRDEVQPYYRRERFSGEFFRSIALPDGLNTDAAEATFRNGMLEIRLPKREELQPRKVEVKAA